MSTQTDQSISVPFNTSTMSVERHHAYLPDTPVCWSISGGLTSGFMLAERLRWGPQRQDEFFCFANTGKEREETLVFLHEIERRWGVDLVWLQRTPGGGIERVTFETAAREGEPFTDLINERGYLPNPVTRFCTTEMKTRVIGKFCSLMGLGTDAFQAIGLRADEMRRVVRIRGERRESGEVTTPRRCRLRTRGRRTLLGGTGLPPEPEALRGELRSLLPQGAAEDHPHSP